MAWETKIYVVQRESGEVVAARLTRESAQAWARAYAPAKVISLTAGKSFPPTFPETMATSNGVDHADHRLDPRNNA